MRSKNGNLFVWVAAMIMAGLAVYGNVQAQEGTGETIMPVSGGTELVIYEKTGEVNKYSFRVADLINSAQIFTTTAGEEYTVDIDGPYIRIHCYRGYNGSGYAVGNNITAVKLEGVYMYPDGLWASSVVDYELGYNGNAASRFNALWGIEDKYSSDATAGTYLGDQESEITLGFSIPKSNISDIIVIKAQINSKIQEIKRQLAELIEELELKRAELKKASRSADEICTPENRCTY